MCKKLCSDNFKKSITNISLGIIFGFLIGIMVAINSVRNMENDLVKRGIGTMNDGQFEYLGIFRFAKEEFQKN